MTPCGLLCELNNHRCLINLFNLWQNNLMKRIFFLATFLISTTLTADVAFLSCEYSYKVKDWSNQKNINNIFFIVAINDSLIGENIVDRGVYELVDGDMINVGGRRTIQYKKIRFRSDQIKEWMTIWRDTLEIRNSLDRSDTWGQCKSLTQDEWQKATDEYVIQQTEGNVF